MKSSTLLNPVIKSRETKEDDFFNPDDISWKGIVRAHNIPTATSNSVTISLYVTEDVNGKVTSRQLGFRISKDIIDKLQWKDGDRVALFYDEKDVSRMMLVQAKDGYVLRQECFEKNNFRPYFRTNVRANFLDATQPFRNLELKSKIDQRRLLLQYDVS